MISEDALIRLIRSIVQSSIAESKRAEQRPGVLSGVVEDIDSDLDVVYVRMDREAMGTDPYVSDNYGSPGIIATTRLGQTFVDEQVRVDFDPHAGASATHTGVQSRIVLPYGAESGQRIIIDGEAGVVAFYDEADQLVGFLDPLQWFVGRPGTNLARLDPIGGLRLWDENDQVRILASPSEGVQVRDGQSGISGAIMRHDGLIILDPETGERISITSGTTSAVPSPHWASTESTAPGGTHSTPPISSFDTGDDIDIRFVSCSIPVDLGANSYTPPSGFTEQTDMNDSGGGVTLATSLATLDPAEASPTQEDFTNTQNAWFRRVSNSVIVRGGDTSPSIRGVQAPATALEFSGSTVTFDIDAHASTVDGDLVVVFVAVAGPNIPIGWTVPEGWVQLGVLASGLGTNFIHGSGVWYKRYKSGDPLSETVTINMTAAGFTKLHATAVSIANPYSYPSGLDIRRNNRSMPRGEIAAAPPSTSDTQIAFVAPAGGDVPFPLTVEEITNIDLLAGRTYRIEYNAPIAVVGTLGGSAHSSVRIELDEGSGYVSWHRKQFWFATGVWRVDGSLSRTYTPTADITVSVRIRLHNDLTGNGHNLQLLGAADYRRVLNITDIGAEF